MDETTRNKAERWQARLERVATAQARYLMLLAALAVFYLALLVSEPASSTADAPIVGVRMPLPFLFALGPLAIWLTILANYGTMRMAEYGNRRLRVLDRYVPSRFMDSPNFLDAVVFAPPPPWGRSYERWIARFSYPVAITIPWVEGAVLLYLGHARHYFSLPGYVVAAAYLPPMVWSFRSVVRLWIGRIVGEPRRGRQRAAGTPVLPRAPE